MIINIPYIYINTIYPHQYINTPLTSTPHTGGYSVPRGQDVMISVYNIHHSPDVWEDAEAYIPERFGPLDGPVPNEQNTDYRYVPCTVVFVGQCLCGGACNIV